MMDEIHGTEEQESDYSPHKCYIYKEVYDGIFSFSRDVIAHIDPHGEIININSRAIELTGFTKDEIIGKTINVLAFIFPPKSLTVLLANFAKRMAGFLVEPYEIEARSRKGEIIYFEVFGFPIKGENAKNSGEIALLHDITDKFVAEEKLKKSESSLAALIHAMPDMMFQFNKEGVFINYKSAADELFVPPDKFINKSVREVFLGDFAQTIMNYISDTLKNKKNIIFEYSLPIGNEIKFYESRFIPTENETVMVLVRNVSEKKKMTDSIERLNGIIRSISAINQLIVRANEVNKLFKEACNILVKTRSYLLVAVALIDENTGTVIPRAFSGVHPEYLTNIHLTYNGTSPYSLGPAGRSIMQKKSVVCKNVATDAYFAPWREKALACGFSAVLSVPLISKDDNGVIGVIGIYSDNTEIFDANEIKIIEELADDIVFAMESIEIRGKMHEKISELEVFNKAAVGRELRLIELEKEVNGLLEELNRPPIYK